MAADAQWAQTKAFLMQAGADGSSTYDHLQQVVMDLLEKNSLDLANHPERLADVSGLLKQQAFGHGAQSVPSDSAVTVDPSAAERAEQTQALFVKAPPTVKTTVEQPTPYVTITTTKTTPASAPHFCSVLSENTNWRFAGSGLPEKECLLLDQSIAKLAASRGLTEVRFFGKIFGTVADYLVVTSKRFVSEDEEILEEINTMPKPPRKKVEVDVQMEPGFKGVNRLSFWVAPHAAAEWTLLPDVTPQQVNAARTIRKHFTGCLDAEVNAFPTFVGSEATLLRAQLSRILSATYVAPSGALEQVVPDDDEEEDDDDDAPKRKPAKYIPLTAASRDYAPDEDAGVHALNDLEQWQHAENYIYETGRQSKVPPKPENDEEEEEPEEPEEEEEEPREEEERELFQPLKKDTLFSVINVPKEQSPEDEEDEEEPQGDDDEGEGDGKEDNEPEKAVEDDDVADDDPLKQKMYPWVSRITNAFFKKHAVCVVKSLRWPGAVAYSSQGGKRWGCVYFGNGMKSGDGSFTPTPAPPVMKEAADITEVADPTAANEKLVLRGEDPKERDSEEEKDEEEEGEEEDE